MDVSLKSLLLLIVAVYFATLAFLGFLHNTKWDAASMANDMGQTVDSHFQYVVGKSAGLLHTLNLELKGLEKKAADSSAPRSEAEMQAKTRSHRTTAPPPRDEL